MHDFLNPKKAAIPRQTLSAFPWVSNQRDPLFVVDLIEPEPNWNCKDSWVSNQELQELEPNWNCQDSYIVLVCALTSRSSSLEQQVCHSLWRSYRNSLRFWNHYGEVYGLFTWLHRSSYKGFVSHPCKVLQKFYTLSPNYCVRCVCVCVLFYFTIFWIMVMHIC